MGTIRRSAMARGPDGNYFAPLITNASEDQLRVTVNAGLEGALDCGCAVAQGDGGYSWDTIASIRTAPCRHDRAMDGWQSSGISAPASWPPTAPSGSGSRSRDLRVP